MDDQADFSHSFTDENTLADLNDYAILPQLTGNMDFEVIKTDSLTRNRLFDKDHVYPNFSAPKGLAVIFNNRTFYCGLSERKGTEFDEYNIRQLLMKLGYDVRETKENLGGQAMLEAVQQFAANEEHKLYDSCAVVVLTHGKYDSFCGSDGKLVNVHHFIDCFNAVNAPYLKGKPKLFFIQACRGNIHDFGTDFADSEAASKDFSSDAKHPSLADILIAYATTPNYVSWRNSRTGSWFIQSICEIFSKYAAEKSILNLLTKVNEKVANFYETYESREKQMPQFHSSLRKKFYFFPGVDNTAVTHQHEIVEQQNSEILCKTPEAVNIHVSYPKPPLEAVEIPPNPIEEIAKEETSEAENHQECHSELPLEVAEVAEEQEKPRLHTKDKIKRELTRFIKRI